MSLHAISILYFLAYGCYVNFCSLNFLQKCMLLIDHALVFCRYFKMSDSKAKAAAAAKGASTEETAKRGRGRPRKKPQVGDVIFIKAFLLKPLSLFNIFILKLYGVEDLNMHLVYLLEIQSGTLVL